MLCFELTMPNIGSWNGKWSGEHQKHYHVMRAGKVKETALQDKDFRYDFGDGWAANIHTEKIDAKEATKRERLSKGFCGYEWMVGTIIKYGEIKST